jgi:phage-related protein
LHANLSQGVYLYKEELEKYVAQSQKIYGRLHNDCKKIKSSFTNVSNTLSGVGDVMKELFNTYNDFDMHISEGKEHHLRLKDCYVSFNNILISWGQSLKRQAQTISDW